VCIPFETSERLCAAPRFSCAEPLKPVRSVAPSQPVCISGGHHCKFSGGHHQNHKYLFSETSEKLCAAPKFWWGSTKKANVPAESPVLPTLFVFFCNVPAMF